MKDHEFLRVIEEACLTLNLSRPCIAQVLSFYQLFQNSETHSFKTEVPFIHLYFKKDCYSSLHLFVWKN